jgi:hypothetical protein
MTSAIGTPRPISSVTITSGATGSGNGMISFSIAANHPAGAVRLIPDAAATLAANVLLSVGTIGGRFGGIEWQVLWQLNASSRLCRGRQHVP